MAFFFNRYPYTDFHELNLDWIISKLKDLKDAIDEAAASAKDANNSAAAAASSAEAAAGSADAAANSAEDAANAVDDWLSNHTEIIGDAVNDFLTENGSGLIITNSGLLSIG